LYLRVTHVEIVSDSTRLVILVRSGISRCTIHAIGESMIMKWLKGLFPSKAQKMEAERKAQDAREKHQTVYVKPPEAVRLKTGRASLGGAAPVQGRVPPPNVTILNREQGEDEARRRQREQEIADQAVLTAVVIGYTPLITPAMSVEREVENTSSHSPTDQHPSSSPSPSYDSSSSSSSYDSGSSSSSSGGGGFD
jgi:hypothetical protein